MADKNQKPEKPRKLSKQEQEMEDLQKAANNVIALWMQFRKFFRLAFSRKEITPEIEQQFLEIKSSMTQMQRFLAKRLPSGFQYGAHKIKETMGQVVTVGGARELPVPDKKKLYEQWHQAYIRLENLCGILDVMRDGYPVKFEDQKPKSGNIKQTIGGAGNQKKKIETSKIITVAIVLAVLGGVLWLMMNQA